MIVVHIIIYKKSFVNSFCEIYSEIIDRVNFFHYDTIKKVIAIFSNILKTLRKTKKITQEQLAEIIGVERSSIAKYESTNTIPSIDVLLKISNYFNVSLDYLLENKQNEKTLTKGQRRFAMYDDEGNIESIITDEKYLDAIKTIIETLPKYEKED